MEKDSTQAHHDAMDAMVDRIIALRKELNDWKVRCENQLEQKRLDNETIDAMQLRIGHLSERIQELKAELDVPDDIRIQQLIQTNAQLRNKVENHERIISTNNSLNEIQKMLNENISFKEKIAKLERAGEELADRNATLEVHLSEMREQHEADNASIGRMQERLDKVRPILQWADRMEDGLLKSAVWTKDLAEELQRIRHDAGITRV